jgi:hypothetical protein
MKLSEAMILGSTMIKHVGHAARMGDGQGCAIQCAMEATGTRGTVEMDGRFPWFYEGSVSCPVCGEEQLRYSQVVAYHLNDFHKWPIDRIAEWVSQFETQVQPEPSTELLTCRELDFALTRPKD